jgi:uncharacterized protein YdhG (YjbR/CyaY superfamily)
MAKSTTLSKEERAAMKETVAERKRQAKRKGKDAAVEGEKEVIAKIAEMPRADKALAKKIHALVKENAPGLVPRTWYGMPAYTKDGKVLCFFQGTYKFKARYATLGFNDSANLDQGEIWPTSFALTKMTPKAEKKIAGLLKKAAK